MATDSKKILAEIGARPRQRFLPLEPEEMEKHRRIYCAFYENCLDHAISLDWISWSCSRCEVTKEISMEDRRDQAFEIFRYIKNIKREWT